MAIRSIRPQTYEAFDPPRSAIGDLLFEEVEWFVDSNNIILGVVVLDREDNDWSYAVLGRDLRGSFRAIGTQVSIETRNGARERLLARMEAFIGTGQTVFPQGDEE